VLERAYAHIPAEPGGPTDDAALVERPAELGVELGSADALIVRNRTQVDAALLARAPRLKVVGRLGVGLDNIDLDACAARQVEVIAATGANAAEALPQLGLPGSF